MPFSGLLSMAIRWMHPLWRDGEDTGKPDDIFEANRLILDDIEGKSEGQVEESQIMGRVVMEKGPNQ